MPYKSKDDRREQQRRYREKNRAKLRAYHKNWRDAHPEYRMEASQRGVLWRQKNPEKAKAINRRYSAKHPEIRRIRHRDYVRENLERWRANCAVSRALKSGSLYRPDSCERCGATARLHGHHVDYSRPLEVMWLCPQCHRREHPRAEMNVPGVKAVSEATVAVRSA